MYKTRKEFLQQFMRLANISSMKEADRLAQVFIGLIKAGIPHEVSETIATAVPLDLSKGWRNIALPSEALEMQEMMGEMEEVGETPARPNEVAPPEYG